MEVRFSHVSVLCTISQLFLVSDQIILTKNGFVHFAYKILINLYLRIVTYDSS